MNEMITTFTAEFANTQFNHSDHLFAGLRSGTITLSSASDHSTSTQGTLHYLNTYEHRLNRLDERFGSKHTEHTQSLRFDTADLCDRLRENPEEICDLWIFTEEPYYGYAVFVGRQSRTIFGCLRTVDNQLVTPEIRTHLWGETDS